MDCNDNEETDKSRYRFGQVVEEEKEMIGWSADSHKTCVCSKRNLELNFD